MCGSCDFVWVAGGGEKRVYGVWGVIDCCESELNVSSASGCLFRLCVLSVSVY